MRRVKDWVSRFEKVLNEAKEKKPDWADHNCCTFAADCVFAITGIDAMAEYRGKFKTKKQAFALLRKVSGGGVNKAGEKFSKENGLKEVKPTYAKRGDLVIAVNEDKEEVFGIIDLSGRYAIGIHPVKGIAYEPLAKVTKAWNIP